MNLKIKLNMHHQHDELSEYFIMGELRQDLILQANSDNKITLELYTGRFFNNWVDVTGYSFDFIVKNNPTDSGTGTAVLFYHVDAFQDPTHGRAVITIPKADCELLIGNYFYQITMTNSHGHVRPIKLGLITFLQDLMA